jgi:hypothetical protein
MLIENTEANIKNLGDIVTLMPGVNDVDPALWDKAQKIALVQHFLKSGVLKVVSGGSESHKDIAALEEHEALELVDRTVDHNLLTAFAEQDKRGAIRKAIDKQLAKITPTQPEKKGK